MSKFIPYWDDKDPDERLAYKMDWSGELGADTIQSATFTIVSGPGLVKGSESHADREAIIVLSGGTLGQTCEILNRINTAGGEILDKTAKLRIRKR